MGSLFKNPVTSNETVRIARHIKNFHSRALRKQLFGQDSSVHPGHHDVCQEQMNLSRKIRRNLESLFAAGSRQHLKTTLFQKGPCQLSQGLGILRHEYRLVSPHDGWERGLLGRTRNHFLDARKKELERGTFTHFAVHPYITTALFHDAVDCRKP